MRYLTIIIAIVLLNLPGSIVCSQQVYFNNRYQFNEPGVFSTATSAIDCNNGYLITGATEDTINQYWRWIHLVQLSDTGTIDFIKYIGNNSNDFYPAWPGSFHHKENNVFFAGNIVYYGPYHTAGLLIKLSESLDSIWSNEYFGDISLPYDSNQHFNNMDLCANGDFIFTGELYFGQQPSQMVLLRADSNGSQKFVKYFGSTGLNSGYSVIQTTDGGFAIGGFWYEPGSPYQTGDPIVIKTDSLGNKQWEENLGGPYKDNKAMLCKGTDGSIIAGTMYADSMAGSLIHGDPYSRIHIIKMDNDGNIVWDKKYGESRVIYNYLTNIRCLEDGSIIACGSRPTDTSYKSGWIMKVNSDGDSLWLRYYDYLHGYMSMNYLYDVIPTSDNGFLACGYVFPMPPDTGTQDAWVIKLDSMGCDTPGCATGVNIYMPRTLDNEAFLFYPNPASSTMNCRLPVVDGQLSMFIYDMFGRKQEEIQIPKGQKEVRIDVSTYPAGIYVAMLSNDKGVLGRRKFVVSR